MKSTASPYCSTNFPCERWWDRGYNKHLGASGWHLPISGPNQAPIRPRLQLPFTQILLIRGGKWVTVSSAPPPIRCETHCQKHTITDAPRTDPYHPTEGLNYFQTPPKKSKNRRTLPMLVWLTGQDRLVRLSHTIWSCFSTAGGVQTTNTFTESWTDVPVPSDSQIILFPLKQHMIK